MTGNRLDRLRAFLAARDCDAAVLTNPANIAAFFRGAQTSLGFRQEPPGRVAICVTATETVLLGNRTEVARMQHDELPSLSDLVTEAAQWDSWDLKGSVTEYLRSRGLHRVCDDKGFFGENIGAALQGMYYPLSELEQHDIRKLAQDAAGILESVAKNVRQGTTEIQIAGQLSGSFISANIRPEYVMIASDERISKLRHCMPKDIAVRRLALLSATVHRQGLYASMTRIVSLGQVSKMWTQRQDACNRIDATGISLSTPGRPVGDVFKAMVASYAAQGYADEWKRHHQGGPAGFCGRDYKATMHETRRLVEKQPIAWNPTVCGAKSEDTILTSSGGAPPEILTHTRNWVYNEIATDVGTILRPAILAI